MIEQNFFEKIEQVDFTSGGHSYRTPVFYLDATAISAGFLTPLQRLREILPSPRLQPLRATPWHGVTVITAFEFRETDIGPYNEVAIAIPITLDKSAPVFTGLRHHMAKGPMIYVHHLPVTTEIARFAGVEFYGYPKFIAKIDFAREGDWLHCHLAEGDRSILTLSAKEIDVKPEARWRSDCITVREGRLIRSEIMFNQKSLGVSRNRREVRLDLGDHPISDELRSLNLGRMLELRYLPHYEAILSGPLESFALQEGKAS